MDQGASSAAFGSRALERAADIAMSKLLAAVAMMVMEALFGVAIYLYWFDLRSVLLCAFFNLFYAVIYYKRRLRNRRPVLRRGLRSLAVFLGMGLLLLFYSFAAPGTPWWLPVLGLFLLPVAAYYLHRFLAHHLELEDDEAVQLQLQLQLAEASGLNV